jgi:hypothetical protein
MIGHDGYMVVLAEVVFDEYAEVAHEQRLLYGHKTILQISEMDPIGDWTVSAWREGFVK